MRPRLLKANAWVGLEGDRPVEVLKGPLVLALVSFLQLLEHECQHHYETVQSKVRG